MHYFFYSLTIIFLSWAVGEIVNNKIKNTSWYKNFKSLNFIQNSKVENVIGLKMFKWLLTKTILTKFNPKLRLKKKTSGGLIFMKQEMTNAEISHLIAFLLVNIIGLVIWVFVNSLFGITTILLNILMNLYPSLLQQQNKRRINKILTSRNFR